jgi:hypothetical protein
MRVTIESGHKQTHAQRNKELLYSIRSSAPKRAPGCGRSPPLAGILAMASRIAQRKIVASLHRVLNAGDLFESAQRR